MPPTAGPRCPRCHRPLAAWRLEHCVYCGEAFPAELKQGFEEPEALKWVERPALPADLNKKLENAYPKDKDKNQQVRDRAKAAFDDLDKEETKRAKK